MKPFYDDADGLYFDAAEQFLPALAGAKAERSNLIPPFLTERTRIS
jgi:hypothetical protein